MSLYAVTVIAQQPEKKLTVSAYAEAYYTYDFDRPENNSRASYLYNYSRHNEFNLNLGYVKVNYSAERVRGNVALAVGTYMNANYAAEPGVLKNVFEANAGYKLSAKKNLWLDIGIIPSHIGFESAVGKDNWTLTRSFVAENSPYFESGAKLSFTTDNNKLTVAALALNGWQRITRVDGNSLMSWGTQIFYKPTEEVSLNYSTFIGSDKPDIARLWRYYHDLYAVWQANEKIGITAGLDMGWEQKVKGSEDLNNWIAPLCIVRYKLSEKWAVAYRFEYFKDKNGVIIPSENPNGFDIAGNSINIDYIPADNIVMRIEARHLESAALTFSTAINF
ncbi:MAG: porin [Chitinophagaceae bacterium]|nr:porin [Chitinophagaceae bacterium]